jgi:hypothetical protein
MLGASVPQLGQNHKPRPSEKIRVPLHFGHECSPGSLISIFDFSGSSPVQEGWGADSTFIFSYSSFPPSPLSYSPGFLKPRPLSMPIGPNDFCGVPHLSHTSASLSICCPQLPQNCIAHTNDIKTHKDFDCIYINFIILPQVVSNLYRLEALTQNALRIYIIILNKF